jgi:hypothetical protein
MNRKTHPSEEAFDELCRAIVKATQASDAEIHAAANAPFLYQRLRAQIAAEPKPIATLVPPRSASLNFVAALGAWAKGWRWALAAAALALVVGVGWQARQPAAPQVATQRAASASPQDVAHTTAESAPATTMRPAERAAHPAPSANKIKAAKTTPNKPVRVVSRVSEEIEAAEITTEFLPLTYTAQRDEQNAQIVRMEMPRSVLATLGVPVANVTGDRIKADVMLRDDGVALAIRFIQEQ